MLPSVNLETRALEGPDIFGAFFGEEGVGGGISAITGFDWATIATFFSTLWGIISVIAILLSLLFLFGFIYAKIRLGELIAMEAAALLEAETAWAHVYGNKQVESNRWEEIKRHVASDSPNDWRLAIIEADILLEETLEGAGYIGSTVANRLKSAATAGFSTIQDAWSAHKVRNQIAHEGSDFVLTRRLAEETVMQYERVFREFGAI